MSTRSTVPTLSLVTPNYNGEDHLADAIDSIRSQAYPRLEYIFVDGASTDRSKAIAESRREAFSALVSEPDAGHADALNKGFAMSSGEIMGWINSDDILLPGALESVAAVFTTFPNIEWITARPTTIDAHGALTYVGPVRPWSRLRFLAGDHFWIQQESTFWRRSLWERAGGLLDDSLQVANDFELWARFFRHATLYSVDRMLGCFRVRDGQRSVAQLERYMAETRRVIQRELDELEPAFRARHGASLPKAPVHLSEHQRRVREPELAREDPPILTGAVLRSGRLDAATVRETHFELADAADEHETADVRAIMARNWRFLAALFGAAALLAAALVAAPAAARVWIFAAGLSALTLAVAVGAAVKTRRIVLRMERDLRRALSARARAEWRHQQLEVRLDAALRGKDEDQ